MIWDDFNGALLARVDAKLLTLPKSGVPQFKGTLTEKKWAHVQWQGKPDWATLNNWVDSFLLDQLRELRPLEVHVEESKRITKVYIGHLDVPQTTTQELFYRIRTGAATLAPKDTKATAIHKKGNALRKWLASEDRTLDELKKFNVTLARHWL